ncbi:MAG TPA: hypothetical protein VFW05_17720 [Verrucomicrobiae bacterium]|nr:hypothetical protein [Verrucomicrobiae bacterium]
MKFIPPIACAAMFLTGCCQNRVVFTTHSSLGLDVSGTAEFPNRVSFSSDRYEAAIVPRKTNGESHSVYGGMDADMTWFSGHAIRQTFATGEAAKLATGGDTEPLLPTASASKAPLIFYTGTTYGLNISAGEQSMPPNLLLGYRRTEATIIPIPDPAQEVRSVYADIQISTGSKATHVSTNFSTLGGVRIKQSFATGKAAEWLARNSVEVRQKLAVAAGANGIEIFGEQGNVETQIEQEFRTLSSAQQMEIYQWADATFPEKSAGRLAETASIPRFLKSFLPSLNAEERQQVLEKIKGL